MTATLTETDRVRVLADKFIEFLETNRLPEGLLARDFFADVTVPTWRLQADSAEGLLAIRLGGHPIRGEVIRRRVEPTLNGFIIEFEERWRDRGQDWYSREMIRADVSEEGITDLSVYCTGDWDEARVAEHRAAVTLLRP
jgi:hypothetical protein